MTETMTNEEIKDHAYAMIYLNDLARTIYDAVNDVIYDFTLVDEEIPGFEARVEEAIDNLHKLGEELESKAEEHERLMWKGLGLDISELDKNKEFVERLVDVVGNVAKVSVLIGDPANDEEEDDEDDRTD